MDILNASQSEEFLLESNANNGFIYFESLPVVLRAKYDFRTAEMINGLKTTGQSFILANNREQFSIPPPLKQHRRLTFVEALNAQKFLDARELWLLGGMDIEDARVHILLNSPLRFLVNELWKTEVHTECLAYLISEIDNYKSYMLLLLHAFPRILLLVMLPDAIRAPLTLERPDWNWRTFLLREIHQLNGTVAEVYREIRFDGQCYCGKRWIFNNISIEQTRILAELFCSSVVIIQHDQKLQKAWVVQGIKRRRPAFNPLTTFKIDVSTGSGRKHRCVNAQDIRSLMSLSPPINCSRSYIDWTFYYPPLLEIIKKHSGMPMQKVEQLTNTTITGGQFLSRFYCFGIEKVWQYANMFCSAQIVLTYSFSEIKIFLVDHTLTLEATTEAISTFRLEATATGKFRTITKQELQYLKDLRWQARLPALLVAAHIHGGRQFHVFKHIALFF